MRILAVDDDPVMLDLLGNVLEGGGFGDITFATTAEDALELIDLAARPYDAFLLDVMLPRTSGIEVCKVIRSYAQYRSSPVLMITACRARNMMTDAFDAGATDFVNKPFDALELITRIRLAAMLSDSIARERTIVDAVLDLDQLTEISLDTRFDIPASPGAMSFLALENELLRRADAVAAKKLFGVHINNAGGLYRSSKRGQFREIVRCVAGVLSIVLDTERTRFAYAGRGDMIAITQVYPELDLADLQSRANNALADNWSDLATELPNPPKLTFRGIKGPAEWSGKAAADAMRSFQGRAELAAQADPFEVDGLFQRLSVLIRAV